MVGFAGATPDPMWPNNAKVCLSIVVNYEEGGENCLLHGDSGSEGLLSEMIGCTPYPDQRHTNMESLYEYGSRAGFWRLHRVLTEREMPVTVYAVGMALERNPQACAAMMNAGWEVRQRDGGAGAKDAWSEATARTNILTDLLLALLVPLLLVASLLAPLFASLIAGVLSRVPLDRLPERRPRHGKIPCEEDCRDPRAHGRTQASWNLSGQGERKRPPPTSFFLANCPNS